MYSFKFGCKEQNSLSILQWLRGSLVCNLAARGQNCNSILQWLRGIRPYFPGREHCSGYCRPWGVEWIRPIPLPSFRLTWNRPEALAWRHCFIENATMTRGGGRGGREDEERIEESTAAKQFTQILGFCYIHVQLLLQHLHICRITITTGNGCAMYCILIVCTWCCDILLDSYYSKWYLVHMMGGGGKVEAS